MQTQRCYFRLKKVVVLFAVMLLVNSLLWAGDSEKISQNKTLELFTKSEISDISAAKPLVVKLAGDAQKLFQDGDFLKTIVCLEKIQQQKSFKFFQVKVDMCKALMQKQNTLVLTYPKDDKEREKLIKSKYEEAEKLFKADKYAEAKPILVEIWTISGNYKDTCKYINEIETKLEADAKEESKMSKGSGENLKYDIVLAQNENETDSDKIAQYYENAKRYLDENAYDEARSEAEKILLIDPNNSKAAKIIKKVEAAKEKESAKLQESAENARKENIAKQEDEIKNLYNAGQFAEAIKASDKLLKEDAENSYAQKIRTKSLSAIEEDKANQNEKQIEAQVADAQNLLDSGNYDSAIKSAEKALALDANNSKAMKIAEKAKSAKLDAEKNASEKKIADQINEADDLYSKGEFDAAISTAEKILKDEPNNSKAAKILSKATAKKDEQKEIQAKAEMKAKEEKEKAEAKAKEQALAEAKAKEEEVKANAIAKEKEEKANAEAKAKEEAATAKAKEEEAKAELKAKEEQAKAEQKAKEEKVNSMLKDAESKFDAKDYEGAILAGKTILAENAGNSDAIEVINKSLDRMNRDAEKQLDNKEYSAAVAAAEKVLKIDPENAKAKQIIDKANTAVKETETAKLNEEKEKKEKQLKELQKLEDEKTEKAKDITDEGVSHLDAKEYDKAIAKFDEALSVQPLYAKAIEYKEKATLAKETQKTQVKQVEEPKAVAQAQPVAASPFLEAPAPVTTTQPADEPKKEEKTDDVKNDKINDLLKEAQNLADEDKFDEAQVKISEVFSLDPKNTDAVTLKNEIEKNKKDKQIETLIQQAEKQEGQKAWQAAVDKYNEVLVIDPQNKTALAGIENNLKKIDKTKKESTAKEDSLKKQKAQELFDKGLAEYKTKNIEKAVELWNEAIANYPEHKDAKTYLAETREEYEKIVAAKQKEKTETDKESTISDKMNTPITISTRVPTRVSKFLENLSIITGINFSIAEGVEANVEAKFEDKPLSEVLDSILLPIGLKWERKAGSDIVIVRPDLITKVFPLKQEEMARIKSLYDTQRLQKILWGEEAIPKLKGVELTLDEREMVLISVDSKLNQDKIKAFLEDSKITPPPGLVTKSYNIDPQKAKKIKAFIEARIQTESNAAYSKERKLIIDESGENLFIKDTPENIKIVEDCLKDRKLWDDMNKGVIEIQNFSLIPKNVLEMDNQTKMEFFDKIVTALETLLYSREGKTAAREKGRNMWSDPIAMQITVTDYPDMLKAVGEYIESLPQIERKKKSKIIFLKNATAADLKGEVENILGIESSGESEKKSTSAKGGANSVQKSLSVNKEIDWQGIKIRLTRVNENDVNDEYDDSAEFVVRTPTQSSDVTLEEFRSEFVEDYEITALEVKPSGTEGKGRAKIEISYSPGAAGGQMGGGAGEMGGGQMGGEMGGNQQQNQQRSESGTGTGEGALAAAGAESSLVIESIDNLNALLIRYENPAEYAEVMDWIEQFDIPVLQVSIETKFVEVIENKAKEFGSEFAIQDITESISFDKSAVGMRFADSYDEIRNAYEPAIEDTRSANLLKGTTVLNLLTFGNNRVGYTLRLLEAEGIINVVNGPHITTKNKENASFQIERTFNTGSYTSSGSDTETASGISRPIQYVDMDVEPTVTYLGSIDLELTVEMYDFDQNLGQLVNVVENGETRSDLTAMLNLMDFARIRKNVETKARIKDGGTIVLGGWTGERSEQYTSGVPVLRHIPFVGKMLFGRNQMKMEKTTLLIFLTGKIVD